MDDIIKFNTLYLTNHGILGIYEWILDTTSIWGLDCLTIITTFKAFFVVDIILLEFMLSVFILSNEGIGCACFAKVSIF